MVCAWYQTELWCEKTETLVITKLWLELQRRLAIRPPFAETAKSGAPGIDNGVEP